MVQRSFIRGWGTSIVWDNYAFNGKIQNEAARIVRPDTTKLVPMDNLLIEKGLENLLSLRKKHKLLLYYKMR